MCKRVILLFLLFICSLLFNACAKTTDPSFISEKETISSQTASEKKKAYSQSKEKLGLQKPPPRRIASATRDSDTRAIKIVALDKSVGQQKEIKLYNKSYAVIIGIDQYKNLPYDMQLLYAVHDAKGVADTLKRNFKFDKIITIYNKDATKEHILRVLSGDLSKISNTDSVFIFYAGHGLTQKTDYGDLGYLVPFDGTFNESELYKNISMTMIKDDISKRIRAKHIFYVMDACYSGLLATKRGATRKTARDFAYLKEISKENVRQVLTAGNKDQAVLDGGPKGHSVFTGRFIEILENTDDFITATEISSMVKEKVFSDAKARGHIQTPQYGELFGLGDYVFVPSLEQKVEDTQAELAKLQNEKRRLEKIEKQALKAKDEMARRQAELEIRAIEAKLLAEQLRQETLVAEKQRREQEEAEQLREKKELTMKKKETDARLVALKREVEDKRKAFGDITPEGLSPTTNIVEMQEMDARIEGIKRNYLKEMAVALSMVSKQVNGEFEKAKNAQKDEFESDADFKNRVERMKSEAAQAQTKGFVESSKKIEVAYNKQIAPFIENLKKLSGQEFTITAQDLILVLHEYDAASNSYPVTIKSQKTYGGIMIACSANIPILREEAKIFKQHYANNILRPEISGNFQSTKFFRVAQAFVIDDSTNKKYNFFSSSFVDMGNDIIYDNVTKLLWLKDGNYFRIKKRFHNWDDAKKLCDNLTIAGLTGWRLPTSSELVRMYTVYHKQEPHPFVNLMDGPYCTSSLSSWDSKYMEMVNLRERKLIPFIGSSWGYIWPVRGSK